MKKTIAAAAIAALCVGLTAMPLAASAAPPASCRSIPVDADPILKSDLARAEFGVDGTGVKVGIISNSYGISYSTPTQYYSSPAENVAEGLLPGAGNPCGHTQDVVVLRDMPLGQAMDMSTDEGRAMAQMVHGIAPGAQLFFASAGVDLADTTGAIQLLQQQGVDIIVDDIIGDTEPFYQQSTESTQVAAAVAEGITYLSAAGNNTVLALEPRSGQDTTPIGAWETAAYREAVCDPSVSGPILAATPGAVFDCLDFDPGVGVATISNILSLPGLFYDPDSATPTTGYIPVIMQWGEGYGSSTARFEMIVSTNMVDSANENQPYTLLPVQSGYPIRYGEVPFDLTGHLTPDPNDDFVNMQISIVRYTDGDPAQEITPPIGFVFTADGTQWAVNADWWRSEGTDRVGRSIVGHNGAPEAISVAATGALDDERVEDYSSLGPVTYYLTPETDGGPVSPLPEPVTLHKPTIMSVDGVRQNVISGTPIIDSPNVFLFSGTSAATPTAGAVAALALQLDPTLTPAEVQTLLRQTATPIAAPYATIAAEDSVGAGLVNAQALLAAVSAALPADPNTNPVDPRLAVSGGSDGTAGVALAVSMLLLGSALIVWRRRGARV